MYRCILCDFCSLSCLDETVYWAVSQSTEDKGVVVNPVVVVVVVNGAKGAVVLLVVFSKRATCMLDCLFTALWRVKKCQRRDMVEFRIVPPRALVSCLQKPDP